MTEPREIKFRLIEEGKIVGYEKHVLSTGTIAIMHAKSLDAIWRYIYPDYKYWIPHDDKEQFTGLKDKNGTEIFKGDIVDPNRREILWANNGEGASGVGFYSNCRSLLHSDSLWSFGITQAEVSEVIGNIHQNPELLNG